MEKTIELDDLDTLSDTDAQELMNALQFRFRAGTAPVMTDDETLVWDTINGLVGQRRQLGDVLLKCGKNYSRESFSEDVEFVTGWLDSGTAVTMKRPQRMALVTTALDLLARQIKRNGAPVIHKTLVQQLVNVPAAVDAAFPSYQESKLLHWVAAMA